MAQYGIKEVMNVVISTFNKDFEYSTPFAIVDYAQVTGLEHSAERIDIRGGWGNPKLLSFDHSKTVTMTMSLPLVDFKLLSKISGDDVKKQISKIFKSERLTIKRGNNGIFVNLERKPLENSAFFCNILDGRDLAENIELEGSTHKPNRNRCSLVTVGDETRLYFNQETIKEGTEVLVNYIFETKQATENIVFSTNKFPKYVTLRGECLFRNQITGEDEIYNFTGYKASFQDNYSLTMSATDPTVLELTIDFYAYKHPNFEGCEQYYELVKDTPVLTESEQDRVIRIRNFPLNGVDDGIIRMKKGETNLFTLSN